MDLTIKLRFKQRAFFFSRSLVSTLPRKWRCCTRWSRSGSERHDRAIRAGTYSFPNGLRDLEFSLIISPPTYFLTDSLIRILWISASGTLLRGLIKEYHHDHLIQKFNFFRWPFWNWFDICFCNNLGITRPHFHYCNVLFYNSRELVRP